MSEYSEYTEGQPAEQQDPVSIPVVSDREQALIDAHGWGRATAQQTAELQRLRGSREAVASAALATTVTHESITPQTEVQRRAVDDAAWGRLPN